MKVSLILGINGQDGSLLAKEILESGGVFGVVLEEEVKLDRHYKLGD